MRTLTTEEINEVEGGVCATGWCDGSEVGFDNICFETGLMVEVYTDVLICINGNWVASG